VIVAVFVVMVVLVVVAGAQLVTHHRALSVAAVSPGKATKMCGSANML
jgi:formate/nitrite transporter FocA (FNT family)